MTISELKRVVCAQIINYPVEKVTLFGSRAEGTEKKDSDVDLIIEFSQPVSLLTLNALRFTLEDALNLPVDLIHGPLTGDDMIFSGKEVVLFAA